MPFPDTLLTYFHTVAMITDLDFMVCGVAPQGDHVALLTYSESEARQEVCRLRLCHPVGLS